MPARAHGSLREVKRPAHSHGDVLHNQIFNRPARRSLHQDTAVALDLKMAETQIAHAANPGILVTFLHVHTYWNNVAPQAWVDWCVQASGRNQIVLEPCSLSAAAILDKDAQPNSRIADYAIRHFYVPKITRRPGSQFEGRGRRFEDAVLNDYLFRGKA